VTVGGRLPRLLHVAALGPWIRWSRHKHVQLVALKPNKDLARVNALFEAGQLRPVIDGRYALCDLAQALRHFGTGLHQGKIVVTMI
jgi:NADPH:quinone reductase-like Zn-dependent oxidoreductase